MANEFPPTTLRIRERSRNPSFLDLTDLLGSQLIAVGFRLYDGQRRQHIVFGGKDIKRITPNFYPLKVIKRYCRLYLQKVAGNAHPTSYKLDISAASPQNDPL